ncbi:nitroreductase family deazaflavin-dependent oxidoreductase [Streptacidiphilus sp. PB12-B1b]|uniref:nitroreductase family deazaflavin-dependent oxidoreductase n=1 Tax=Streptacidiphilus sp. PB12-B1b TaxID=2705012 RepID=UPI0015FB7AB6|nr:nitroreductase family deazaflavin-dependent oxidoreductase [Streptacidiphilus sp. PB12-B1b]QMU75658.1 nitroreductase family deazaflavin-dependent oxidoreductase [Streptacidiphilus sp. PB12-B1b]
MSSYNDAIIAEFRSHGGKVGGTFEGAPLLLLTTTGAKSGRQHTTPLMYMPDGDRWLVFASYAGAPANPAWYHNAVAHPDVVIEVGAETVEVTASVLDAAERDRVFAEQVRRYPGFGEYQDKTSRVIPVVALERRSA